MQVPIFGKRGLVSCGEMYQGHLTLPSKFFQPLLAPIKLPEYGKKGLLSFILTYQSAHKGMDSFLMGEGAYPYQGNVPFLLYEAAGKGWRKVKG